MEINNLTRRKKKEQNKQFNTNTQLFDVKGDSIWLFKGQEKNDRL